MNLVDLAKGRVRFVHYQQGMLWYKHLDHDFMFPVPTLTEETGEGIFLAEDKALLFMRWIRPRFQLIEKCKANWAKIDWRIDS